MVAKQRLVLMYRIHVIVSTVGYLSFGPIEKLFMFSVTLACARRTGAAARVESEGDVSAEHCLQCEAGEPAGVTRARPARPLSACTTH